MTDVSSHSTQHSVDPAEPPDPDFINWLKEHCVPVVGTIFGALLLCFGSRYSSVTIDGYLGLLQESVNFAPAIGDKDRYIEPNEIVERQSWLHCHAFQPLGIDTYGERRLLWIIGFAHNEVGKSTRIGEKS